MVTYNARIHYRTVLHAHGLSLHFHLKSSGRLNHEASYQVIVRNGLNQKISLTDFEQ